MLDFFVRNNVLLHAMRATHGKMLTLAVEDERVLEAKHSLDKTESLELFVRELGGADLTIGLVAPDGSAKDASVAAARRKLTLPDDSPMRIHRLRNSTRLEESIRPVAIEVVCRLGESKAVIDQASTR